MAKVIVRVDPRDGTVSYEVNGVKGEKCEEITSALTRDNEELDKHYTEEYYVPETIPDEISEEE